MDMSTIAVPPALPTCMSVGVAFAISRLKKKQIYCVSPQRINISANIRIFVFDKTGTLTEDGMKISGIKQNNSNYLGDKDG